LKDLCPQTRFVLKKAFKHKLKPIVCVNKVDRPGARPLEVYDKVIDLFIELGADEDDLFFPHVYTSGASGFARLSPSGTEQDMQPLFEMILEHIPGPEVDPEGAFQLQVTNLDYSDYLGRMFGGKVRRGKVSVGNRLVLVRDGKQVGFNVTKLWVYHGISLRETETIEAGEIAMLAGVDDVLVGDSICSSTCIEPLPPVEVEPPTLSMNFYANNSPLAGKDGGKFLTIHKIRERLEKEERVNVAFKIDKDSPTDTVKVFARGELQLAILIENMRRESFELCISRPQVIFKQDEQGKRLEPFEVLTLDLPDESVGAVMEELSRRKAEMLNMVSDQQGRTNFEYRIPTRGLIGFRSNYLTLTRGMGIMASLFDDYYLYAGPIESRTRGALVSKDPGKITRYAYEDIQIRGTMFYPVGTESYAGMVVGENSRDEDMIINITKAKAATNMRSATSEATTALNPHKEFSLEQALSWIKEDELLEVTPKLLRFCKKILDHNLRKVAERRAQ
jgi:GTP-binding protein